MSYTTIQNVAGMFPTFQRGTSTQKPGDALIQQYIDDISGELDAILQRRFNEVISVQASFSAWLGTFPAATALWKASTAYALNALVLDSNGNPEQATTAGTSGATQPTWPAAAGATTADGTVVWTNQANDASRILEKINRYGAAAQLGEVLATFGVGGVRELAKMMAAEYERMKDDLDARGERGSPLPSGPYDHLFDTLARTETPRPGLKYVAGGELDPTQTPATRGTFQSFGKFDKRGT